MNIEIYAGDTVSVIIPTYNGAKYIAETLPAAIGGGIPHDVIVVDDRSTDGTTDIVVEFAANSVTPIQLLSLDRNSGGPAKPMNVGVAAVTSRYVACLDQDDVMAGDKLERHVGILDRHPEIGLVFGQGGVLKSDGVRQIRGSGDFFEFEQLGRRLEDGDAFQLPAAAAHRQLVEGEYKYGGAGGVTFRKAIWEAVGGFDESLKIAWDYDFALRVTRQGCDVGYCPATAYFHRRHNANLEQLDGGLQLARERVAIFEKQCDAEPQPSPELVSRCTRERLSLVWRLRKARRFGDALQQLDRQHRRQGRTLRTVVEAAKTWIARALAAGERR